MATKEIRQQARKKARELLALNKKERLEVEHRRDALAVTVMTSLGERDALVAEAEKRAGTALTQLVDSGLSLTDAVGWCGNLTEKEAGRLMKLAATDPRQVGAMGGGAKASGGDAASVGR